MSKKDPKIVKAELGQIMQLLLTSHTDKEIIRDVGISQTTYYKYKAKLFKESAELFAKKDIVDIAFHVDILHDRLTSYLRTIEDSIKTAVDVEEKIDLINTARELAEDIHDLNVQSLELLVQKRGIGGLRIIEQRIQDKDQTPKELL
jgi:ACT domain-containing protein